MEGSNHGNILYGWNLVILLVGYAVFGLTWWGLLLFWAFVNCALVHGLVEAHRWHEYANTLRLKLKEKTTTGFTADFAQRLQEELEKKVEEMMAEAAAGKGFTYRKPKAAKKKAPPQDSPSQAKPRNDVMKLYGLQWGYTQEEVTTAYRRLVKKYHPDLHGGNDRKIKQVNLAKEWLDLQIKNGWNV